MISKKKDIKKLSMPEKAELVMKAAVAKTLAEHKKNGLKGDM